MKPEFNILRPCLVSPGDVKGLCHGIFQYSYLCGPSSLIGGHPGGMVSNPIAVVELEDGSIGQFPAYNIKFLDRKIDDYDFTDERGG